MNNKLIIALDQGSSSSRALAINMQGELKSRESVPVNTLRPIAGQAELNAEDLLSGQVGVLEKLVAQVGIDQVACLALSGQRSTVVFWDKITGKPLGPVLSWQDGRAGQSIEQIDLTQESVHQITGLYKTPFYSAAKIKWALDHIPAVSQAAKENRLCIGPTVSYIIWHLTAGQVFACDATLAQRMLLFNIHKMNWDEQLLNAFGIQRQWLPQLKRTCDDYGAWNYQGHQIPINVCIGDQQAALCALRVVSGGSCINYGTGAFFMRNIGKKCHLLPGLLTSVATSGSKAGYEYLLEGPLNACATVFTWLNSLGLSVNTTDIDDLASKAQKPIWFLPALGGLGAPYWDFSASPVMSGLSAHTSKADIVAGVVQGLTYLMADIVFYAERFGFKSSDIKVSGGLANSYVLLQTQANILQTRLLPCAERESTAVGAALLAAEYMGENTSVWETLHLLPVIQPNLPSDVAEKKYDEWHAFLNWCKSNR